ncbi:hypothetical protein KCU67_g6615, partial [Aureobasidium melanogenum]
RLILRLQMEDLASIWASSTTSTDDGTELDADVSLRLYRHELRTADQQIDDGVSARAAAQDELRQRDAIRADREEARRLFQELNPDEPLPEPREPDQLLLTDHLDSYDAPVKDETSSVPGPLQCSDQPRPAQDDDSVFSPAKKQDVLNRSSPLTFGTIQSAIGTSAPSPALSGPFIASQGDNPSEPILSGKSSARPSEVPRFCFSASLRHRFTSATPSGIGQDTAPSRTASTAGSEALVSQTLAASNQPVAPGQQSSSEPGQTSEIECLACCTDVVRTEAYINTCGHPYCRKCVNRLFKTAVRDESLWPPQCCKAEMSIKTIEHLLREDLIPLVKVRQVEMSTHISDRTYCATCTTFIPENKIREKTGTCSKCWTSTCTECKEKDHIGDCQIKLQQDIKDLELLAEKNGWKKCSNCLMLVEHNTGCNHMT